MNKKEIIATLMDKLAEAHRESENRPFQYVVGYFNKSDESLIGYHMDTFCSISNNIFDGKRYSGENPAEQLAIIWKNITYTLSKVHEGIFSDINNSIKEDMFKNASIEDIYIDAIYIDPNNMPKQEFRYQLIDNTPSIVEIDIDNNQNLN